MKHESFGKTIPTVPNKLNNESLNEKFKSEGSRFN